MKKGMLKLSIYSILLLCVLMLSAGDGEANAKFNVNNSDRELSVMTRNMYLGTDFGEIFAAQTPEQLVTEVAEAYAEVEASKPAERIAGIAGEIETASPDLVGLQEVALWRIGAPFDPSPAEFATYDFLQLLLDELAKRGLHYRVVKIQTNFDAEVPAVFSQTLAFDVRFTDRIVVLARTDLATSQFNVQNIRASHFIATFTFSSPTLGTLTIPRGWISVDVEMNGRKYRFVNTHLESFSPFINYVQAAELTNTAGNMPVVFAGDFNSDAENNGAAYRLLLFAGFRDVWRRTHPNEPGFTWALFLVDPSAYTDPFQRIDLILIRGRINALDADLVGENPATDRTPSGLMRSDHAGVIASLELRP